MAYSNRRKTYIARGMLELWEKYSHGKTINPETMDLPSAGTGGGSDHFYAALISFMCCFSRDQWRGLQVLYRPDIRLEREDALRIGVRLRPAWDVVMQDEDYYRQVVSAYYRLVA